MTAAFLTILGMGLVTYLTRLAPMQLYTRLQISLWVRQALRYVPTAVLTAIIFTEVLLPGGSLDISIHNGRLLSALLAAVVAWRTGNVLATIAVGMIALWILQAIGL
jgi:branched-subunit amino acid transport protein